MRGMVITSVMCVWLSPVIAVAEAQRAVEEPVLLEFVRDYAATAGLRELKTAKLKPGASEIRIWTGFGVIAPDHAVIIIAPDHAVIISVVPGQPVEGRALNRFSYDPDDSEDMRELLSECTSAPQYREDMVICDAKLARPVDWEALYKRIDRLGITVLPDESSLPPTKHRVHDGAAILVEIAAPHGYRAYSYSNPMFRSEPEAQAALGIMCAVNNVFN